VQRDRIQSGLSLAVVPVQTDVKGGTMHTVGFAEEQRRLLFCPTPPVIDAAEHQFAGINMLIRSGRAQPFQADGYELMFERLREQRAILLVEEAATWLPKHVPTAAASASPPLSGLQQPELDLPGLPPRPPAPSPIHADEERLIRLLKEIGLTESPNAFDGAIGRVRARIFGQPVPKISPRTGRTRSRKGPKVSERATTTAAADPPPAPSLASDEQPQPSDASRSNI
jgi:hypothetical protein